MEKLYRSGRLGEKTGAGWYRYNQDHKPVPDSEILAWIESSAKQCGLQQRDISDEEILDRCTHALINEGARILEEGYALRSVDIDIVYLTGYGFPMFYADTAGLANVYARLLEFHRRHGTRWEPAPLLRRLAEEGRTFSSFGTMALQKS